MSQRFSLDRQSFERFLASLSQFQPLQWAYANRISDGHPSLLLHLLETLRAIDSGELTREVALQGVASLAHQVTGADGAAVWLLAEEGLCCEAAVGDRFDVGLTRVALRTRLQPDVPIERDAESECAALGSLAACFGGAESATRGDEPSLLIAVLPGGGPTGALAVFSRQPAAFTREDGGNLRLLAGLAQYILTRAHTSPPMDELYLPGVATRAALSGDVDERARLGTAWRTSRELLAARARKFTSASAHLAHRSASVCGRCAQVLASPLEHAWKESRLAMGTLRALMLEQARVIVHYRPTASPLPAAAKKLAAVCENAQAYAERALRKVRRIRFWTLKLLVEAYTSISSAWKDFRWQSGITEQIAMRVPASQRLGRRLSGRMIGIRVDGPAIWKAAPALAASAIMTMFVVALCTDRHIPSTALVAASPPTAEAPTSSSVPISPLAARSSNKAAIPVIVPGSHLQITDRATEITIAAMSPYEVRTVQRAADYGDDEAAFQLGMLYELGRGVPQSCSKAAESVRKAAQLGNTAAEYNLGLRYRDGDGVEVNPQESEHWLRKALLHGDARARQALAALPGHDEAEPFAKRTGPGQLALKTP